MKIRILLHLFLMLAVAISCNSREEEPIKVIEYDPLLTKLSLGVYDPNAASGDQFGYYFEYNSEQKLTKKIGGFLQVTSGAGYSGFFSNEIYTSLVYSNNIVTVENFSSSSQFTVPKESRYFKLNNADQIMEKEIPNQNSYFTKKAFYSYKNGLLDEIKTTLPNMPFDPNDPNDYIITYSEKFFYDASKNLIRTEYYELQNGVKAGKKNIRTFGNYDSSYNPFRRLTLLDECFYRSLSKNNFRTYQEVREEYGATYTSHQNWEFNYDTKGNIILN